MDVIVLYTCRALVEAQKVFGLDFDMDEFAAFGDDKTSYLDEEEEEEDEEVSCCVFYGHANNSPFLKYAFSHASSNHASYLLHAKFTF